MKNIFLLILIPTTIIVVILVSKVFWLKDINQNIKAFNMKYEEYLEKEIYGNNLATIINKAIDDNKKENLTKKDENYININIKIIDYTKETIIEMEKFYNGGIDRFVEMYGSILFKCNEIKYSEKGKVNYLLFEQITQ